MNFQDHLISSPIVKGDGIYLYTKNKKKYFDSTGRIYWNNYSWMG